MEQFYSYKPPRSAILERSCTKDWARQLIRQKVHPRGCIWCPGEAGERNQHLGDLYAPDPEWEGTQSLSPKVIMAGQEAA